MATNYPGSSDAFNVPTSPSTTPLSSAGTGTRNHTTHHRDLGDAVVALQNNVTKTTHDHTGTGLNGPKLVQAVTHENVDTDQAANSLHHTIGAGAFQAAAGNHNHDSRYLRIDSSVAQTVTGKKTFPSGVDSIAIPDFRNSKHSHVSDITGGGAAVMGGIQYRTMLAGGPSSGRIGGASTIDSYLHPNRFTIPANMALNGFVNISYYADWVTGDDGELDSFWYISYNQGESPAWSASKNALLNGGSLGGLMVQRKFYFRSFNTDWRDTFMLPIYIPPTNADRNNMCLVMRIFNRTNNALDEVNWGINLQMTSQLIAL